MSAAKATIAVTQTWFDGHMFHAVGTIAIGADPLTYTANGIAMDLRDPLIKASRKPVFTDIHGRAGFIYKYIGGTDVSNGLLRIFAQTSGAAEDDPLGQLTDATAIPAACSGDTIGFHIFWLGQN